MKGHGPTLTSHSRPFPTIVVAIGAYSNGSVVPEGPTAYRRKTSVKACYRHLSYDSRSFIQCRRRNDWNPLGISAPHSVTASFSNPTPYYMYSELYLDVILASLLLV